MDNSQLTIYNLQLFCDDDEITRNKLSIDNASTDASAFGAIVNEKTTF